MHDSGDLVVNDMTTRKEAEDAVYTLLTYLDSNPDREGLKDTPRRVIDFWDEVFGGYKTDAKNILEAS